MNAHSRRRPAPTHLARDVERYVVQAAAYSEAIRVRACLVSTGPTIAEKRERLGTGRTYEKPTKMGRQGPGVFWAS